VTLRKITTWNKRASREIKNPKKEMCSTFNNYFECSKRQKEDILVVLRLVYRPASWNVPFMLM
jgi:hypothetical protein